MRIIIDIGHPAHVHFFKNAIRILEKNGHEITVVTKDKDVTLKLLDRYQFDYINLGKPKNGLLGKACGLLFFDCQLYKIARQLNPDLLLGFGSPYMAHVSKVIHKPYISFWDTENARLLTWLTYPFTDTICSPSCFQNDYGKKHIRYAGYKELAYLHPNYFTPDASVLEELDISRDEKFIVVRFISLAASHDVGLRGVKNASAFIKSLEKYGRVLISSEGEINPDLEKYMLHISPDKYHSLLSYASLYIGEGGTVATESALLGTPAIHIESTASGQATGNFCGNFLDLRDNYGLLYFYPDQEQALEKAKTILENKNAKQEWIRKREKVLNDKSDVTKWIVDFVEHYPVSACEYREKKRGIGSEDTL